MTAFLPLVGAETDFVPDAPAWLLRVGADTGSGSCSITSVNGPAFLLRAATRDFDFEGDGEDGIFGSTTSGVKRSGRAAGDDLIISMVKPGSAFEVVLDFAIALDDLDPELPLDLAEVRDLFDLEDLDDFAGDGGR